MSDQERVGSVRRAVDWHRAQLVVLDAHPLPSARAQRKARAFHLDHIAMHTRWLAWQQTP